MAITTIFDPPLPSDSREVFDQKAFDVVAKLNPWSSEANALADDVNAVGSDPGVIAIGADLVGANNIGAVAANSANINAVAVNIANVNATGSNIADVSEVAEHMPDILAALADLPALAAKVSKTGDTMTGHLSVPAGATGNQVPRASEVVSKAGDTMTGPLEVPAGATGDQVPRANEVFGKSQTEQTVARTSGVTYTNSTGKPIVVTASATTTAAANALQGHRNGEVAIWSSWPESSEQINIEFVVFPGATYKLVAINATDLLVKEYR